MSIKEPTIDQMEPESDEEKACGLFGHKAEPKVDEIGQMMIVCARCGKML